MFYSTNTREQLFVLLHRDLKTQNVFMKKKGNICKIGEDLFCSLIWFVEGVYRVSE